MTQIETNRNNNEIDYLEINNNKENKVINNSNDNLTNNIVPTSKEENTYENINLNNDDKSCKNDLTKTKVIVLKNKIVKKPNESEKNSSKKNEDKKKKLEDKLSEEYPKTCKICLEPEKDKKNKLINPCNCTGSCEYIHEICLKHWINTYIEQGNTEAPRCEICGFEYYLKFFLKIELNKEKKSDAYKKMALEFILYLILLTAIVVIICLIICKMFIKKKTGKIIFICIMSFVGIVIVIIIVYSKNSDWKEKCKEKNVKYWKVMTKNEVENLRKTHKNDYDEELNDMRCSLDDWYLYFIKDIRQIIYLNEDE